MAAAAISGDVHEDARPRRAGTGAALLRAATVLWIWLRVGALWLVDLGPLRRLWYRARGRSAAYARVTGPVAWRLAFERLGPTYIKLGQMIASGDGLFPPRYSEEFRSCLDAVPPFPFAEVERTLDEEWRRPHRELLVELSPEPLAAASIAQVHTARLRDGREVVVKVQRPGIRARIEADLAIMKVTARVLSVIVPYLELANPLAIVLDLERTLLEELDFRGEARNMAEFDEIMRLSGNTEVVAPAVHGELTRPRVLVMERFRGWRVDDTAALRASPYDGEAKLLAGIRGWFQCLLRRGFFHGDVHAGNFLLLEDGRVGFLDFGIVGRLDAEQKAHITEYVLAFQSRDFARLADVLVAMGSTPASGIDKDLFAAQLRRAFAPMVQPGSEARIRDVVPAMMRVAVKNQMRMPREFVLVTKQLVYLDRYARALGGPGMNVLTDQRVMMAIMEDMARMG
jgi:predicted unusual protein kinase regulating ubiquinone biosynthesis (AarF/ABC1/UbiB family)